MFQAFAAPFPAVLRGLAENARPPCRDGAPPGRAGRRERGRRSEARRGQHSVRSFREIQGYHSSHPLYTFCSTPLNRIECVEAFLLAPCHTCRIGDTLPICIVEPSTWAMMLLGFAGKKIAAEGNLAGNRRALTGFTAAQPGMGALCCKMAYDVFAKRSGPLGSLPRSFLN